LATNSKEDAGYIVSLYGRNKNTGNVIKD